MADDLAGEIICPDVDLLTKVEKNLSCPLEGCNKLLPNTSSLRMHLVKTHNVVSSAKESEMFDRGSSRNRTVGKKKTLYCCPVDNCVRGRTSGRPFSRLAHVKQHYMTIHGEKKFTCKICDKKFGRNDACLRHERACGKVFTCLCGCPFTSRTSMLTHAKRNGHSIPSTKTTERAAQFNTSDLSYLGDSQPVCVSVLPVGCFRPLRPKTLLVNAETQTDCPFFCDDARPDKTLLTQIDKSITVDIPFQRTELNVVGEYAQTVDKAYRQTSLLTDEQQFDVDFAIDTEEFKELAHSQTQTNWELAFGSFPLFEDNETQTLESYLGLDPSSVMTDCATQTKSILDDIFSVDSETQTLVPAINFAEEPFEGNSGIDIHTQTMSNIYVEDNAGSLIQDPLGNSCNVLQNSPSIANVETQTS